MSTKYGYNDDWSVMVDVRKFCKESLMLMSFLFIELVKRNRKYEKKYLKNLNGVTTFNKSLFFQQYVLKINAYNNIR